MSFLSKSSVFELATRRVRARPEYLGWVLARFIESEHKTDKELADFLSTSVDNLNRMGLCLRPRSEFFAEDVSQIARKFGVKVADLASIARHVEVLEGMRDERAEESSTRLGLMMAARARGKKSKTSARRKKDGSRSK